MRDPTLIESSRGLIALAVCVGASTGIWFLEGRDSESLRTAGMIDWVGHSLTALIIAIGIWMLRLPIPIWSILIGGIVLDLGHLLTFMSFAEEIPGSSRNGSHSLLMVAMIAMIGFVDHHHATGWLGIALGALSHLWRDMGTGTVPLLWPMMDVVWGTSFWGYLLAILGMGIALVGSGMLLDVYARARHRKQMGKDRS